MDITNLLRFTSPDDYTFCYEVMCEAAEEIERLREANGRLTSHNKELQYHNYQQYAELQRLQQVVEITMKDMAQ